MTKATVENTTATTTTTELYTVQRGIRYIRKHTGERRNVYKRPSDIHRFVELTSIAYPEYNTNTAGSDSWILRVL